MIQQRIKMTSALAQAVRDSLPIVRQLASERAKPWPTKGEYRLMHQNRISDLEAELARVAARIDDLSGNELERLGIAELRNRRYSIPSPKPVPIDREKVLIDAETAEMVVESLVEQQRRVVVNAEMRLAMLERDLADKQRAVALAREQIL